MKERISRIIHALNENLFEREEVLQLAILTTIAGESIFLLGPPGVAKSLIARRIKEIFKEGTSFEYLMNRFSTPDEIFGPIAISKLKNEDTYERKVQNYLPTADIVFLDEIWKAGPSIQNSLLTVINEKIYRNGEQEIKIPMKGLISASNELPTKGEGLEALWDRFIIRYLVENIEDINNFNKLITSQKVSFSVNIPEEIKITNQEFDQWQEAISKISVEDEVINVIHILRGFIRQYNTRDDIRQKIYVSDRRWTKIVRILKTSAFLNGRTNVDMMDCFLIMNTIWDEEEQIHEVREFVLDAIKNHGFSKKYNLAMFDKEIATLTNEISETIKHLRVMSYYEPKSVTLGNTTFYKVEGIKFSKNYGHLWHYIKKTEFEKLDEISQTKICINKEILEEKIYFEGYRKSPNELTLTRIPDEYTPENYKPKPENYKLLIDEDLKVEIALDKVNSMTLAKWDSKLSILLQGINNNIKEIDLFKQKQMKSFKENIFVDSKLSSFAEHNLNQSINSLIQERIKVEKLKKKYELYR